MGDKCCGGHNHKHEHGECGGHGKHKHGHGECGGHGKHKHGHGECDGHGEHKHGHGECDGHGEHKHDHEGCGCDEEMETVTITLEDDTEMECGVLGIFDVEENSYIALLSEDEEIFLYRFEEIDEETVDLIDIEDDEEFEAASKVFNELFDEDFED